jgi:transcription-repair coupling factor (superfamily II helicase)
MRDLEIRGAGNLLGIEQSGNIAAVGLDLYTRMLKEEVARLKGESVEAEREIRISVPLPAYLPSEYVPDSEERMDIYRRLSRIETAAQAGEMASELRDRFGPLPESAANMLRIVELKARAAAAGIDRVEIDRSLTLKASFSGDKLPSKKQIASIVDLFPGRLIFHTREGFGMTVKGLRSADGKPDILRDFENLLKSLEFSDK